MAIDIIPDIITDIIQDFKTNHSSVVVTIFQLHLFKPGPSLWKFNYSLINDETFYKYL